MGFSTKPVMRVLNRVCAVALMLGWTGWFAICNVYEFAPVLDPRAFALGWLLTVALCLQSMRTSGRRLWSMALLGVSGCNAFYLLLIYAGTRGGIALAVLIGLSGVILGWAWSRATRGVKAVS